ncbi:MAG: DMT family transporter [Peptococcaceae bacterium]|nr:DMT family transporter [Peptococcaceae bacterium]
MDRIIGIILVAVSAAAFGISPIFARFAFSSGTTPVTLLFFRFIIAAFIMLMIMFFKRITFPRGKTLLGLILMGSLGYVGQSFSYFTALTYASASLVALLLYLYPILVTILAVLVLKEKVTKTQILALIIALIGTVLIIGFEIKGQFTGIVLGLSAACIYSVSLTLHKKCSRISTRK